MYPHTHRGVCHLIFARFQRIWDTEGYWKARTEKREGVSSPCSLRSLKNVLVLWLAFDTTGLKFKHNSHMTLSWQMKCKHIFSFKLLSISAWLNNSLGLQMAQHKEWGCSSGKVSQVVPLAIPVSPNCWRDGSFVPKDCISSCLLYPLALKSLDIEQLTFEIKILLT